MEGPLEKVSERLEATRTRLERWQISARAVADEMKPGPHRDRRFSDIDRVTRQIEGLIADNTAAPSPLIRVIGALVPRN